MSENTTHELGSRRPNHYAHNHSTSGSSIRNEEHTNINFKSQVNGPSRTSKELDKSPSRGGNNKLPPGNTKQHRRQQIYASWYDDNAEPVRDLTEDELIDAVLPEFASSVNSAYQSAHICSTSNLKSQFEADLVEILISDDPLDDAILSKFTPSVNLAFQNVLIWSTSDLISQFEAELTEILTSDEPLNDISKSYGIQLRFDWAAYVSGFLDFFSFKQQLVSGSLNRGNPCCISQHRATGI